MTVGVRETRSRPHRARSDGGGRGETTTARQRHCGAGEATGTAKTTATSTRGRRERRDDGSGAATTTKTAIQNHRSEEQLSTTVQQGTAIGEGARETKGGEEEEEVEGEDAPPDCRKRVVQDGADVADQGGARWRLGGGE